MTTAHVLSAPHPAEVSKAAALKPEAHALLRPDMGGREFVSALTAAKLYNDAVRFIAHVLPRREAVWWALVCAREAAGSSPAPEIAAALEATDVWIRHPADAQRRAAMDAAKAATYKTPAGCAGLAAFLSGGSLSPAGQPEVPPGPFHTAKAVYGAVAMAAIGEEPATAPARFEKFIEHGLVLGDRTGAWLPGGSR
jgi:hypothetical protein